MANNRIQIKRTSVSGRAANSTTLPNAGELALNMTDGILYSTNGSTVFEVGANLTNGRITNALTIDNAKTLRFSTVNTSAAASFTQQNDDNFVFYSTNTAYGTRAVWGIFANSITSNLQFYVPIQLNAGLVANSSLGTAGQVLTTNGTTTYWSTVSSGGGSGTVTSVGSGNGLTGGPITGAGTLSVLANNGIIANSSGVFVDDGVGTIANSTGVHVNANNGVTATINGLFVNGNNGLTVNSTGVHVLANTGIVANTTGTFVNATYIGTISSNNASFLGGVAAASYVQNTDSRILSGNLNLTGTNTTISTNMSVVNSTATVAYFAAGGNVGINNTTPDAKLAVTGTANISGNLTLGGTLQTISGNVNFDLGTLFVDATNDRVGVGNTTPAHKLSINGDLSVTTVINVAANVFANTSAFNIVGNTTTAPTATLSRTGLTVGNSSITGAPQLIVANSAGTTTINTNFISTTSISGNLTGNVTATTLTGNLTGNVAATTISGNLTGNVSATTVSATGNVTVGANVFMNLTSHVILGNTTTAPTVTLTGTGLTAGNTSITGAPQVIVANTSGTTTINANFISTTSISGNLTGNVTATTISGNLTGNVTATTLSGNLTGNVTATTISGNLTGNVSATTVSATGNVTVGANVFMNLTSHVVLGNTTTAPTVTLTGTGLIAGNTSITGAPQIIIANSAGNTTINTTSTVVGSNAVHNLTSFAILGNTTTAPTTTMTGSGVTAGNTSITGAPQIIVANTSGTTTINANFISTTSISGNLTGNVIATTISGNLTGNVIATTATFGSVVVANASGLYVNSTTSDIYINSSAGIWANGSFGTAGHVLTTNGSAVYWATGGGGESTVYLKGGTATVGTLAGGGQNIFRVNANTLNNNTTIATGENATAAGPLVVAAGVSLVVDTGGRVVIT